MGISVNLLPQGKLLKAQVWGGRDNECSLKCVIEREVEIFDIQKYQNDGSLISSDLHASPLHSFVVTVPKEKKKTKVERDASDALRCLFQSKQGAALILTKKITERCFMHGCP